DIIKAQWAVNCNQVLAHPKFGYFLLILLFLSSQIFVASFNIISLPGQMVHTHIRGKKKNNILFEEG
ncbi:hypothetical protein J0674_24480, partial [Vibrio parahaemolyticus]